MAKRIETEEQRERRLQYAHQYYLEHKDKLSAYHSKYYQEHKDEMDEASAILRKGYYAKHKKARAEYMRDYKIKHGEALLKYWHDRYVNNREARLAQQKLYYEQHKEEAKESSRKWQKDHPLMVQKYRIEHKEEIAAQERQWRLENSDKKRANAEKRNALKRQAPGADYLTVELIEARKEYYGNRCYICGSGATSLDHVKPLSKGGSVWPCNLRPICKTCNNQKHNKWPFDMAAFRIAIGVAEI